MNRRVLFVVATVVLSLAAVNPAWAHHPTISATAVCGTDGSITINYESVSWSSSPLEGENPEIDILLNGNVVATGAYVYPGNSFSGSVPAPSGAGAGDTLSMTALAVGTWGDGDPGGQSDSIAVTIPTEGCAGPALGRFTGGGNQVRVGIAKVTRGLTVHCDLLLSNNLEVNWQGNQFHMLEHMTTVACTDDPNITQAPPAAPLDTMFGVGNGRYNGVDGYTINFTFVDAGEPGSNDKCALKIFETANPSNVVLNIPLSTLTGGNLQAHYDQPHK
jgi:hypothetical protein